MGTDQAEWSDGVNPLLDLPSTTGGKVPPPENAAPVDVLLKHELTALNELLAHYVLRLSDADGSQAEAVPVVAELALADGVATAANAIRARAEQRRQREDAVAPDVTQTPNIRSHDEAGTEDA
jgi:hypothetical protein